MSGEKVSGKHIHVIPSKKFKTITVVAKFIAPLNRDTITKRALIPYLLQQGTRSYPSERQLNLKLDELYGAIFSVDGVKKGNHHIISFRLEIANEKFIGHEANLFADALKLLKEIIYEPYTENNAFPEQVIQREKRTLQNKIRSIVDDKIQYANMRLIDEMCANESFAIRAEGYEEDLNDLTSERLFTYYQSMLSSDRFDIYILGDVDERVVTKNIHDVFTMTKNQIEIETESKENNIANVKEIVETQPIQQAKLHIGYRTNCTYREDDYFALQIFNGIFGGFPSSRLFMHVREKHSLAYYVGSRIESHKGLLIVFSGIAPKDYEKTKEIIDVQFKDIVAGNITEDEVASTKELIISQLLETEDHAGGTIELLYNQVIANKERSTKDYIEGIKTVTKEDVIRVAQHVTLDTIYLLTDESSDNHE